MSQEITGSCLCGRVKYEIENRFEKLYLCHCAQCQKTSGSDHVSNLFGSQDGFRWISGEENVRHFEYPDREFSNAFCCVCGSGVPCLNQGGNAIIVRAGTLDAAPTITSISKIFYSERASWCCAADTADAFDKFPPI